MLKQGTQDGLKPPRFMRILSRDLSLSTVTEEEEHLKIVTIYCMFSCNRHTSQISSIHQKNIDNAKCTTFSINLTNQPDLLVLTVKKHTKICGCGSSWTN